MNPFKTAWAWLATPQASKGVVILFLSLGPTYAIGLLIKILI